jgi:hypothetical protein
MSNSYVALAQPCRKAQVTAAAAVQFTRNAAGNRKLLSEDTALPLVR